jgi:myosin-5
LIEDRIGVFALLDEECMMPKGSDDSWALKMHQAFTEHAQYEKPRLSQTAFIVKHYAYDVQYEVGGFIEKNKDTLYEEHLVMLRGSDVSLLSEIFR